MYHLFWKLLLESIGKYELCKSLFFKKHENLGG